MTDKIDKALAKLSANERKTLKRLLVQIKQQNLDGLDVQKLKGRRDIYRVRKGDLRIIFRQTEVSTKLLAIERRSTRTYKKKW